MLLFLGIVASLMGTVEIRLMIHDCFYLIIFFLSCTLASTSKPLFHRHSNIQHHCSMTRINIMRAVSQPTARDGSAEVSEDDPR